MAILFIQMCVSVDGFIEDSHGEMNWFAGDTHFDEILTRTLRGVDGIIFGRTAHAMGAAYWPMATAETEEVSEQIRLMNTLPKYVLTRRPYETAWNNSNVITVPDLPRLKTIARRPLVLFAGAQAAQSALVAGHVEEVRLVRYPVALGGGKSLFAADGKRLGFTMMETQVFPNGPIVTRYAVCK